MFAHVIHCRRRESRERLWQLAAAVQPHRDEAGQREMLDRAEAIGKIGQVRKSAYDMVDGLPKVRMIGNSIAVGGMDWLRKHPRQEAWLRSIGVTPERAVAEYRSWIDEEMKHPFWGRGEQG